MWRRMRDNLVEMLVQAVFERCCHQRAGRENLRELQLTEFDRLADQWLFVQSITRFLLNAPIEFHADPLPN